MEGQTYPVASTLNVYGDERTLPWREDQPLPLTAPEPVSAFKKCNEIVTDYLARQTGTEGIMMRFGEIYGSLSPMKILLNCATFAGQKASF